MFTCSLHCGFTFPQTSLHSNRALGLVCAAHVLVQLEHRGFQGAVWGSGSCHSGGDTVQRIGAALCLLLCRCCCFQVVSAGASSLSTVHGHSACSRRRQREGFAAPTAAPITPLRGAGGCWLPHPLPICQQAGMVLWETMVDVIILTRGLLKNSIWWIEVLRARGP